MNLETICGEAWLCDFYSPIVFHNVRATLGFFFVYMKIYNEKER